MQSDPTATVMGHACVALGQGSGAVRVSRAAVQLFCAHYQPAIQGDLVGRWESVAVQVLERLRAVGRLAAQDAVLQGKTAIGPEETRRAVDAVEANQDCEFCPPRLRARGVPIAMEAAIPLEEVVLGQICVAFGQGTGAVRVSREAVAALRERYGPLLTADILRQWEMLAVQVLERMRAIGRLAAHHATRRAQVALGGEDVLRAAPTVEAASATPLCPPQVPLAKAEPREPALTLVAG